MLRKLAGFTMFAMLCAVGAVAQSAAAPPPASAPTEAQTKFLATADEVLAEISRLLDLPSKAPLKKSIRTRDEIRAYLLRQLQEDKEKDKRYADQRALERFGLLPKNFDLEKHLLDLLTEQVAGLYDPKTEEFYIADWMDPMTQRIVMAHELVHALHDQNFRVQAWSDAAKPNDDAELARHAVLEGSATAGMMEYLLRGRPDLRIRDNPAFESLIKQMMGANFDSASAELAKSPPFIRDVLLFPYLNGALFTQRVLRERPGWKEFWDVFQKPPVSSQQILHPELYLKGVVPEPITLPDISKNLGKKWQLLDENVIGEFGLHSILKQHLDAPRADQLAPLWAADRYAIYEDSASKKTLLLFRMRFGEEVSAARFLGQYGEALEKKYEQRENLFRRAGFFSFDTPEGGVFLQCNGVECVTMEGGTRANFDQLVRAMRWPVPPRPNPAAQPGTRKAQVAQRVTARAAGFTVGAAR